MSCWRILLLYKFQFNIQVGQVELVVALTVLRQIFLSIYASNTISRNNQFSVQKTLIKPWFQLSAQYCQLFHRESSGNTYPVPPISKKILLRSRNLKKWSFITEGEFCSSSLSVKHNAVPTWFSRSVCSENERTLSNFALSRIYKKLSRQCFQNISNRLQPSWFFAATHLWEGFFMGEAYCFQMFFYIPISAATLG